MLIGRTPLLEVLETQWYAPATPAGRWAPRKAWSLRARVLAASLHEGCIGRAAATRFGGALDGVAVPDCLSFLFPPGSAAGVGLPL